MGRHPAIRRPPLLSANGRRESGDRRRTPHDNVRSEAAWVIERTLASHAPVDVFLAGALGRLDERDHGLLRELVLGTLRWLRRLDQVLETAANRPLSEVDPLLLAPLRVAIYQLLFLDRVPAHAAVNEAVNQATRLTNRGGAGFANAVLRRVARAPELESWPVEEADPVRRLAIEQSHPDLLVAGWMSRFGETRTRALLAINNQPKPFALLAFTDRGGRELLAEQLIDEGLEIEPSLLAPHGLLVRLGNPLGTLAFRHGQLYIQDEISQVVALLPPPAAGDRVLDAAAAPGGKGLALLAHQPDLRLAMADVDLDRLALLVQNLRRLGRTVPLVAQDAGVPAFAAGSFDRVVLDLPCSGTGTLRRHPELKWRVSSSELMRLAGDARRLLDGIAPLVAPGGLLVMITCSLEPEENEVVVERFLGEQPEFEPFDFAAGLAPTLGAAVEAAGRLRILPAASHDGFTVHVVRRGG